MALLRICEGDNFFADYDTDRGMYRVHVNDIDKEYWFDAYEEKELDKSFPQTIGDITFYSKADLFEWVENQQRLNKITQLKIELSEIDEKLIEAYTKVFGVDPIKFRNNT